MWKIMLNRVQSCVIHDLTLKNMKTQNFSRVAVNFWLKKMIDLRPNIGYLSDREFYYNFCPHIINN